MTLIEIGPDYKALLNKEWLLMIPQFKRLIHRDRGSEGDNDGRKKYKAIREFTFIYHLTDPRSPLENTNEEERREKALQYAEMTESKVDAAVVDALEEYEYLLSISVPTLRLLRASKRTLDKLVVHFDKIDFDKTDKMGRQVHSPSDHIKNVNGLSKLHQEIQKFEEVVTNELKQVKQARGKAELSDREQGGGRTRKWLEGDYNPHATNPEEQTVHIDQDGDPLQLAQLGKRNRFVEMSQQVAAVSDISEEEEE